jgi:hypothetical protein
MIPPPVPSLPHAHVVAGVPVRQSGLTKNRVLKGEARLVVLVGFKRFDQAAVNTAQRVDFRSPPPPACAGSRAASIAASCLSMHRRGIRRMSLLETFFRFVAAIFGITMAAGFIHGALLEIDFSHHLSDTGGFIHLFMPVEVFSVIPQTTWHFSAQLSASLFDILSGHKLYTTHPDQLPNWWSNCLLPLRVLATFCSFLGAVFIHDFAEPAYALGRALVIGIRVALTGS